ncbi:hypothetical protein GGR51DRAFT_573357 [Nemania sp. FL0031]|nr:hypothetical protein GGR51DRAFT_573357 [Nemania sp. FL0031]
MANNIEDAYAPNWRPYFTEQGRLISDVNLAVDCGICGNKLAITQPDNDDNETFAVLPCGHVFGYRCISQWLHRSQSPTCPTCRRSLQHLICGHKIRPRQILGTEFNIHRDLEVVIEDGEDLPGRCASCQAELDRRRNAPHQPSELEQQFVRMIREAERAADQPRPENPLEILKGHMVVLAGPNLHLWIGIWHALIRVRERLALGLTWRRDLGECACRRKLIPQLTTTTTTTTIGVAPGATVRIGNPSFPSQSLAIVLAITSVLIIMIALL